MSWDADSDFEPEFSAVKASDKWEGEDEDDDVKDDWDADSEEEKSKEEEAAAKDVTSAAKQSKKKKLRDKIALKEAQMTEGDAEELTPEEKLAEKMHLQKLEESTQLALTRDMLGLKTGSIDSMVPETKEDFEAFGKAVCEKVRMFTSSDHFHDLLDQIVKDLTLDMPLANVKKVKIHVEGLHSARLKEEKAAKTKKAKGGLKSLKKDLDKDLFSTGGGVEYDDMDDFM